MRIEQNKGKLVVGDCGQDRRFCGAHGLLRGCDYLGPFDNAQAVPQEEKPGFRGVIDIAFGTLREVVLENGEKTTTRLSCGGKRLKARS